MKNITVMVVEDSPVARELIVDTLNSDPRLSVVCAVDTGEKALRMVPRVKPDVISMDIRLPGMNGIEATRRIMEEHPTPIVVVAADLSNDTINNSMEALRAGALSVVEKPTIDSADAYAAMARRLCGQFVNMSTVKVVRQRFNPPVPPRQASPPVIPLPRPPATSNGAVDIVGIVASTGGPPAVATVLQGLGAAFPAPVLVVQHMGAGFLEGYASWLNTVCDIDVLLARDGVRPEPGRVYVGPGRYHLTYRDGRLRLVNDWTERGHVPSGDRLFESLATSVGPRGLGVLLTGMGQDGAAGLLAMRQAGARTIGQDRATCAVYGMPAAAKAMGAVCEELPIGDVAVRVRRLVEMARRLPAEPLRILGSGLP
jgi:two-component system, chemotaxis family, protein-glutamate methylesterase/glutaminase